MTAIRIEIINKRKIEEFYWAGRMVIYIDNQLFKGTFEEAVNECMK